MTDKPKWVADRIAWEIARSWAQAEAFKQWQLQHAQQIGGYENRTFPIDKPKR